ncbi:BgTH12-01305 [Blumeria graminis f. sp. triticale]|uniref:Bgt-4590 n=3 Tax=Blumeria graminis TaxID=34373 RepID=A0A061HQS7_BLUGR|nr:hypothetical protein BGT96224_4590 [Blumeria graminis f. sp. tritici 96224]CAD6505818.1 BgTH12-01305 [Blumeria graminis f. sp. triticale]VDB93991.1 Bgt-4590 [Blumeria graminis f. sp. tritici]
MGSPAVIIVVRHGARLDAADPQWHLTSPTPYDPPLTYGGWSQSKSLGARIANLLRSRENGDEALKGVEALSGKVTGKRRHNIIIHTSPFLRCVQTSIAISAGLAQSHGTNQLPPKIVTPSHSNKPMHSSPMTRLPATGSTALLPIPEPSSSWCRDKIIEQPQKIKRATLRVDAFLGEWLSPDYFDQITPPPGSVMMVTSAKADLLRREDYSNLVQTKDYRSNQPFPGGWGCSDTSNDMIRDKQKDEGPLSNLSTIAAALPRRDRTFSLCSSGSHGNRHRGTDLQGQPPGSQDANGVYQPPVPSYAVSGSDPIPPGYVSHARDACINVDYQWDSMREPHNWGNGGEYGEEWSSMHKRFRSGLQNLIEWYQKSDEAGKNSTRCRSNSLRTFSPEIESAAEDTDLVIILVTHGAGCNALIGALTNQPVLLDVGMASLTMATRKPVESPPSTGKINTRSSSTSRNSPISSRYEVKLVASNEHLRSSASSTPSSSRAPSVTGASSIRDRMTNSASLDMPHLCRSRPQNSCLGSIRRTASVTTGHAARSYTPHPLSSVGLWTAPRPREETEEDEMILNFGTESTSTNLNSKLEKKNQLPSEKDKSRDSPASLNFATDGSPRGLWGPHASPSLSDKMLDNGQKRRWTVDDHESMLGLGRSAG